jgi:hypothetical protein
LQMVAAEFMGRSVIANVCVRCKMNGNYWHCRTRAQRLEHATIRYAETGASVR